MGTLMISNELVNEPLTEIVFKWLRREYQAEMWLYERSNGCHIFRVEGPEIPDQVFQVRVKQVVPKVLSIRIEL